MKHLHCLTRFVCIDFSMSHLLTLKDALYYLCMPGYTKHNLSHIHLGYFNTTKPMMVCAVVNIRIIENNYIKSGRQCIRVMN